MTAVGPDDEEQEPTDAVPAADHPGSDAGSAELNAASEAGLDGVDRLVGLPGEMTRLSLRLDVTWLVGRDMSPLVNHDNECVDLVVDDVVRCWQDLGPVQQRAQPGGLEGFWDWYADRVEFAPSGSDDDYRAEFCPPEPEIIDIETYYELVWRAHATGLASHGRSASS